MGKLIAKDLKIKFIETLNKLDKFSYETGNPFLIRIKSKQYFIFLKNLSPAYFKNSPDVTRVQLPYSDRFAKIFNADIPFIILGYDVDNDTVVCWNPKKIKERLNAKSNVSLYSRYSLQAKVKDDEFKVGYLSNGEKIVIFKRENLIDFFKEINNVFRDIQIESEDNSTELPLDFSQGKLSSIMEKNLLRKVEPLLKKHQVLRAVEVTANYYNGRYESMTFKDWYALVVSLYKNSQG